MNFDPKEAWRKRLNPWDGYYQSNPESEYVAGETPFSAERDESIRPYAEPTQAELESLLKHPDGKVSERAWLSLSAYQHKIYKDTNGDDPISREGAKHNHLKDLVPVLESARIIAVTMQERDKAEEKEIAREKKNQEGQILGTETNSSNAAIRHRVFIAMARTFIENNPNISIDEAVREIQKRIEKRKISPKLSHNTTVFFEKIWLELNLPDDLNFNKLFKTGTGDQTVTKAIKYLFE